MKENAFRDYMERQGITSKAITSRVNKGRACEKYLGYSLDKAVSSDDIMYDSLIKLKEVDLSHSPLQNALRKYYIFVNGKEFPQLMHYVK